MVFELTDAEVQDMNFTVGKHREHVQKVLKQAEEYKNGLQCTCPIKIESIDTKKQKAKLKKKGRGMLYHRRETNGYDIGRKACPIHDVTIKKL